MPLLATIGQTQARMRTSLDRFGISTRRRQLFEMPGSPTPQRLIFDNVRQLHYNRRDQVYRLNI